MYYEADDFLETADSDTLKRIARTRELTREYYFSDYGDTEKRAAILRGLLGRMGEMWQSTRRLTVYKNAYGRFLAEHLLMLSVMVSTMNSNRIPAKCYQEIDLCKTYSVNKRQNNVF